MKKILKDKLPGVFNILAKFYRRTPFFKNKMSRIAEINRGIKDRETSERLKIIESIFENNLSVRSGPFKGMRYINVSFCSALFPKIIGSYEEPIHEWITEAINLKYSNIIDIGSAEGFYSVGFALASPTSTIHAFDIDSAALNANRLLARINNVEGQIVFKNFCDSKELNNITTDNSLIICDIEGGERDLLDPEKSPNLRFADLIVEAHDIFVKDVIEVLIQRFHLSHKIEIVVDYPRDKKIALALAEDIKTASLLIDEHRGGVMKWIRMTRR